MTPDATTGAVVVTGTLSSGTVTLQRSWVDSTWATIGTATGATWSFTDHFAPVAGTVSYRASSDGGATWSATASVDVGTGGWWLRDVTLPALSRRIWPEAGDPKFTYDQDRGEFWPLGATKPTLYLGPQRLTRIILPALMLWGLPDQSALITLTGRGALNLASDLGSTYWVAAITSPDIVEQNNTLRGTGEQLLLATLEFVPVDRPAGVA